MLAAIPQIKQKTSTQQKKEKKILEVKFGGKTGSDFVL